MSDNFQAEVCVCVYASRVSVDLGCRVEESPGGTVFHGAV